MSDTNIFLAKMHISYLYIMVCLYLLITMMHIDDTYYVGTYLC